MSFCGDSSTAELPLFQGEDGGAIPTSPLQTQDKDFRGWIVERCFRKHIKLFIEKWHYSKSINGCTTDYCYRLKDSSGLMIGAIFYGKLAMAGQWKRFSNDPERVIELRRLCLIDATPKNAESFFISKSLRLLRKNWRSDGIVVSYSDLEYGHTGTIYKASNFKKVGETRGIDVIVWKGKRYHDKSTRSYYKGKLKPFSQKLKDALEIGDAKYVKTKGKIAYIYCL